MLRRLVEILIAVAATLVLAVLSSPAWSQTAAARLDAAGSFAGAEEAERVLLAEVNAVRAKHGLPPLRYAGDTVRALARSHSERMLRLGFFAHRDDRGQTAGDRLTERGIAWRAVGENLLEGFGVSSSSALAAEAISAWLASPEHRANLLNPRYTETAVGMAAAGPRAYLTALFLAR